MLVITKITIRSDQNIEIIKLFKDMRVVNVVGAVEILNVQGRVSARGI